MLNRTISQYSVHNTPPGLYTDPNPSGLCQYYLVSIMTLGHIVALILQPLWLLLKGTYKNTWSATVKIKIEVFYSGLDVLSPY